MLNHTLASPRLFFLDWLRIGAVAVLVLFHTGMIYVTWRFHVKSEFAGSALEPWMKLTEPWRMSLLFVVAGASAALWLSKGPSWRGLRSKSALLLLPLVFGMFVVVVPQAHAEWVQFHGFTGSWADFAELYYKRPREFCVGTRCSVLPTWNHLWFLPYLWLYTAGLMALAWAWPKLLMRVGEALASMPPRLASTAIVASMLAAFAVGRLVLKPLYPPTHAIIADWYSHLQYGAAFAVGAALAAWSQHGAGASWKAVTAWRWPALLVALAAWGLVAAKLWGGWIGVSLVVVQQAFAVWACLAWGAHSLNRDHPLRDKLNRWVFPFYILHQTLIVLWFVWLKPLQLPAALEGACIVALTFALGLLGCWLVERMPFLHRWMGFRQTAI